jgi:chromosome segregation ATPase
MKPTLESISSQLTAIGSSIYEIKEDVKTVKKESIEHRISIALLQKSSEESKDDRQKIRHDLNVLDEKVRTLGSTKDKWVGYAGGVLGVFGVIAWVIEILTSKK